ncbi:hypothetical protein [Crenobacter cavernae]|uniref:hypothetical protein n=1 Tax=Crenobacter cavernae TaxID=2290923 RepID=UPI0011C07247|nr:hypothetical protein [Crenobacter cavernae]
MSSPRRRVECGDSSKAATAKHPVSACPLCGERRVLGKRLVLPLLGQPFAAAVCASCHDAAGISPGYRASLAHRVAQHQLYRPEVCHAA